jgi:hypothetical protein
VPIHLNPIFISTGARRGLGCRSLNPTHADIFWGSVIIQVSCPDRPKSDKGYLPVSFPVRVLCRVIGFAAIAEAQSTCDGQLPTYPCKTIAILLVEVRGYPLASSPCYAILFAERIASASNERLHASVNA